LTLLLRTLFTVVTLRVTLLLYPLRLHVTLLHTVAVTVYVYVTYTFVLRLVWFTFTCCSVTRLRVTLLFTIVQRLVPRVGWFPFTRCYTFILLRLRSVVDLHFTLICVGLFYLHFICWFTFTHTFGCLFAVVPRLLLVWLVYVWLFGLRCLRLLRFCRLRCCLVTLRLDAFTFPVCVCLRWILFDCCLVPFIAHLHVTVVTLLRLLRCCCCPLPVVVCFVDLPGCRWLFDLLRWFVGFVVVVDCCCWLRCSLITLRCCCPTLRWLVCYVYVVVVGLVGYVVWCRLRCYVTLLRCDLTFGCCWLLFGLFVG